MLILVALHRVILDPLATEITQRTSLPVWIGRIFPALSNPPGTILFLIHVIIIRFFLHHFFLPLFVRFRHDPNPLLSFRRSRWRTRPRRWTLLLTFRGRVTFGVGIRTTSAVINFQGMIAGVVFVGGGRFNRRRFHHHQLDRFGLNFNIFLLLTTSAFAQRGQLVTGVHLLPVRFDQRFHP